MSARTVFLPACPRIVVDPARGAPARHVPPDATVIVDGGVPGAVSAFGPGTATTTLDAGRRFDLLVDDVLDLRQSAEAGHLVAVGGGTLMDAVKLAAGIPRWARSCWRSRLDNGLGRASLPREWGFGSPVLCVPTTIGTSSETNGSAVLRTADGFTLVQGGGLVPRGAVVHEGLLAGLSGRQRRQGVWEILMRVLGPYVWGPSAVRFADSAAEALIGELLPLVLSGDPPPDEELSALVLLGAETQRGSANAGRFGYAHPLWALANELAHLGGVSKMDAVLATVPGWTRLLDQGTRYGDARRLKRSVEVAGGTVAALVDASLRDAGDVGWLAGVDPRALYLRLEDRWRPIGYPAEFCDPAVVTLVMTGGHAAPVLVG